MVTKASAVGHGHGSKQEPNAVKSAAVQRVDQGKLNRAIADPRLARPADILALQGLIGNQAVSRMLARQTHPAGSDLEARLAGSRNSGSPLPDETRDFMEPRFGADFGGVRVHVGGEAEQLNRELNAHAFTYGRDIYMGEGTYDTASSRGKHLLAHELTHVVQQTGAGSMSAPSIQRAEKVGPLKVLSKAKGKIQGQNTPIYKMVGDARTKTNPLGHFAEDSEVFVLEDNGLGKGTHLFIYGTFNYVKGGSGQEYVWVEASRVKTEEAPKVDAAKPAPAKQVGEDGGTSGTTEKPTWRSIGNLRGQPPVRTEHPHNINVVEDESNYKMLLGLAESALKSITAEADKMNPTGTSVVDNRFWFAKVYQFVTEGELDFVKSNTYYYPSYVLLSVIYFEKIYRDNLSAGMKNAEAHWAEAFKRAEIGDNDDWVIFFYEAVWNLVDSMLAHIRFDLPRAEAWIYNSYYKPMKGVEFDDFKPDFMSMGPIFDKAGRRMTSVIENNNRIFKYTIAQLTPAMAQDFYMTYFEEADMAAERADTWKRAEMLVEKGLNTDDPYTIKGGTVTGDVTKGSHLGGLNQLGGGMKPEMAEEAEEMSDSEVIARIGKLDKAALAKEKTSTRMRMLFALMRYWTDTEDETALLKILEASRADLVELVDAVGAWRLLYVTDLGNHDAMRTLLKASYYGKTTPFTAGNIIAVCIGGETANWEETAVVDILEVWHDNDDFRKVVEVAGVDPILDNVDGTNYELAQKYLRKGYYPKMNVSTAVTVINAALDEVETDEYQEVMIIDILEVHPSGRDIIKRIGKSSGEAGDEFQNGLEKLKDTLDWDEQDRLEAKFE
jgi:hypothetical protein